MSKSEFFFRYNKHCTWFFYSSRNLTFFVIVNKSIIGNDKSFLCVHRLKSKRALTKFTFFKTFFLTEKNSDFFFRHEIKEHFKVTLIFYRYIEEWLSCLAAAGIVRVHENDRFSLPYDESVLTTQGHLASILPIFCESIPKLEEVIRADGPRGFCINRMLC